MKEDLERELEIAEKYRNNIEIENSLPAGNAVVVSDRWMNDRIFVWSNDAYRLILFSRIAWLQADRDYCFIHFKDGTKIIVVHPLKEMMEVLSSEQFARIHCSYVVCLDLEERLVGDTIDISKQDFPVNPAYREDVYSSFYFLGKVKSLYKYKFLKNNK